MTEGGGGYLPLAQAERASFKLAVQRAGSRKRIEATAPDMERLLDLNRQLERLGYQFMRLERLDQSSSSSTTCTGMSAEKPSSA